MLLLQNYIKGILMSKYNIFLWTMVGIAIFVFFALYFIKAGYGKFNSKKWGPSINNKLAWVLMEAPICLLFIAFWLFSDKTFEITPLFFFIMFEIHYVQRAFVFPFLMRGRSKMSIIVMLMGITFNIANAIMQGYWIFYLSDKYTLHWLTTPQFIIGTIVFFIGWIINIDSDRRIRNLRQPGDSNHYLPHGGMYNYVTSANYFGELVEWLGFAIATWSFAGLVFFIWTFANLVPRSNAIYHHYQKEFSQDMQGKNLRRVFPFIY